MGSIDGLIWRGRTWVAANKHWAVLAALIVVAALALADPSAGDGRWLTIAAAGVAVALLAIYALVRFAVWAARQD